MKNKKGMTLIELIVSVALISIVVVFLFQLLIELRYQNLNDTGKVEYKVAATILTQKVQNILIDEEISTVNNCDESNTCLKITFISGNHLQIKITSDDKVLSIIKKDSNNNIILQDTRQVPEKDATGYIGRYGDLSYTTRTFNPLNGGYNYKYDSLLEIKVNMYDSLNNIYPIVVYYPYVGGGNFSTASYTLTVMLDGGTWNGESPRQVASGDTITVNKPTKSGYVFEKWTISGVNSTIEGTNFTMGTSNTVLVANWLTYANMFTYTVGGNPGVSGTDYILLDDTNNNWRIKFFTSGTFTPKADLNIDIFLVGGGASGCGSSNGGGGGGGGYTNTVNSINVNTNSDYNIIIGAGGDYAGDQPHAGNASFFASYTALGGKSDRTVSYSGSSGGSGGGSGGKDSSDYTGGSGGAYGNNGQSVSGRVAGTGQGTTTCEFGQGTLSSCNSGVTLYAGGGGGRNALAGAGGGGNGYGKGDMNGDTNTGGGGGGGIHQSVGVGGSGIVIIRNHQ